MTKIKIIMLIVILCSSIFAQEKSGLIAHYYGNPTFWYHAGTFPIESLSIKKDMGRAAWPGIVKYDDKKRCIFSRQQGWSVAIYGNIDIKKEGEYRFLSKGNQAQLKLGNIFVDLTGQKSVMLKKGPVPLQLSIKGDYDPVTRRGPKNMRLDLSLEWQEPGNSEFTDIPPAV